VKISDFWYWICWLLLLRKLSFVSRQLVWWLFYFFLHVWVTFHLFIKKIKMGDTREVATELNDSTDC